MRLDLVYSLPALRSAKTIGHDMFSKREWVLIAISCLIFFLGCIYYFSFRCYNFELIKNCKVTPNPYGSFPSFVHVFSFSLAHATLFRSNIYFTTVFWFGVNLMFEVGQIWQTDGSVSDVILQYFAYGSYDTNDLIAGGLGGCLAIGATKIITEKNSQNSKVNQ